MRAAKNFTMGVLSDDGEEEVRRQFVTGEEIPDDLLDQVPDSMVLEKVARSNPQELTREQLMELAGLTQEAEDQADEDEDEDENDWFDEEEFREGLAEMSTKRDLTDWAEEVYGLELNRDKMSREEIEEAIVDHAKSVGPE